MSITVERHASDGFTLYGIGSDGYFIHRRYIGYTLREAKREFRAILTGKES